MSERIVKTQTQLDAALTDPKVDWIEIRSAAGVWLEVGAYDSATVTAYDSATVRASGSATVRAYDSATVTQGEGDRMSESGLPTGPLRDSSGRDTRIHGVVLDEGNPGPTLRELLRQWYEAGLTPPGDLAARTAMALEAVGPDGTCA